MDFTALVYAPRSVFDRFDARCQNFRLLCPKMETWKSYQIPPSLSNTTASHHINKNYTEIRSIYFVGLYFPFFYSLWHMLQYSFMLFQTSRLQTSTVILLFLHTTPLSPVMNVMDFYYNFYTFFSHSPFIINFSRLLNIPFILIFDKIFLLQFFDKVSLGLIKVSI